MSLFKSRLLVEGIRATEEESPDLSCYSGNHSASPHKLSFEQILFERAKAHKKSVQVDAFFYLFNKTTQTFCLLISLLLALFGAFAVKNMLFVEHLATVNFFWALALFFIPNLFMLLLWLLFFMRSDQLENHGLYRLSVWAVSQMVRLFNKPSSLMAEHRALFHCYINAQLGKPLGRFQLSAFTHLLWLSYFTGAALMSLVILATHQVDFVWQTSILSVESFQTLTQLLAYLPEKLGFLVPSIEQIQQSYLGADKILDAESLRSAWSSLLISSLLLYGVLPRLLLLLVMTHQSRRKTNSYQLDLTSPYYVQLRQFLKPNRIHLGIIDGDEELVEESDSLSVDKQVNTGLLPAYCYPIAIELSVGQQTLAEQHLGQIKPELNEKLRNICDYQQQQDSLAKLTHNKPPSLLIYVALARIPDRGLKRFMTQLIAITPDAVHLALLCEETQSKQRNSDWYQLARDVGIELDNILLIEAEGLKSQGSQR